jgi:hypothetical protein
MALITGTLLALKGAGSLMAKKTAATAAKGAIKAKAKGALKTNIKEKVKSIAKDKLLGSRGKPGALVKRASIGGALVKTETTNTVKQEANIAASGSSGGNPLLNEVIEIKITTIQIKDLLASNLAKQKAADAAARKQAEKDRKAEKEAQLESGAGGGGGGMKMPKGPKVGPFEAIKRFLLMTFLGSLLAFLLKHHKKVLAVFNLLTKNITATIKIYLALRKLFKLAVQKLLKGALGLGKKLGAGIFNLIKKAITKTGSLVFDALKTAGNALFNFLKSAIEAALRFADDVAKGVATLGKEFLKRGAQVARYLKRVYRAATGAIKGGKGAKGAIDAVKTATQRSAQAASKRAAVRAAQEAAEKVAQEAAEKVAKETAKKVGQETAEKVAQEAAEKVGQEVAEKVVQEGAEQVAKKAGKSFLSRIPFLGGLITAIVSLASGEPVTQAIFKTAGAVLGGFLGSFIPIPVIGTLIGEILGEYIGDLFYTGLMGGGMDAVGKKLQEDIKAMLEVGGAIKNWIGDGFSRLNEGIPSTFGVKNYLVILNPIESVPLFYKAFFTRDSMSKKEEKEPKIEQKFLGGVVNAAKDFLGMGSVSDGEAGSISASGTIKEPKKLPGISLTKIPLKNEETYLGIRYKNNVFSEGLGSIFGGGLGDALGLSRNNPSGSGESGPSSYSAASYKEDPEFEKEVNRLAQKYDIDATDLLGLMASESGLNPQARNKSGATGLIQFMPTTARSLGTSTAALYKMNRVQQMKYVEKYFDYWKLPKGATPGHLYTSVFLPAFTNKPADYIVAKRGGFRDSWGHHPASWYTHNAGLDSNGNGSISIAELGARIQKKKKEFGITGGGKAPVIAKEPVTTETEVAVSPEVKQKTKPIKATPDNNDKSTSKDKLPGSGNETLDSILIDPSKPPSTQNIIHPDLMAGGTFGAGFNLGGVTRSDSKGETSKPKPSMMKIGSGSGPKIARSPNVVPRETASFGSINVKNYQIQESAHYDEPSAQIIIMPPPQQSSPPQRRLASNTGKSNGVPPLFTLNRDINDIVSQAAFY